MGFIERTVKKSMKKLKDEYQKLKKKKNYSSEENIYETLSLAPGSRIDSNDSNISQLQSTSKRNYSSPDGPVPSSSMDSGISEPTASRKKLKKIHFATNSVYEFDRSTLERRSLQPERSSGIYKAKYFEVPELQTVQIIDRSSTGNSTVSNESIPSVNCRGPCESISAEIHYPLSSPPKPPRSGKRFIPNTGSPHYIDPCDLILSGKTYSVPVGNLQKPVRPRNRFNTNRKSIMGAKLGTDKIVPTSSLSSSSSSIDNPNSPQNKIRQEPVYAQITPRRNLEQLALKFSTPISSQFPTPPSSNLSSPQPRSESSPRHSETSLSKTGDSHEFISGTFESFKDLLSAETKESLDQIHQTNWSLKSDDIMKKHDCHSEKKGPIDDKFVINAFESRPSQRWQRHARNLENNNNSFQKKAFIRMSLDSKMMEKTELLNNLKCISNSDKELNNQMESLEIESRDLKIKTKEIKKETKRLHLEKRKRKHIRNHSNANIRYVNEDNNEHIESAKDKAVHTNAEQNNNAYRTLKKSRDAECFRMAQASKALQEIKSKRVNKDWLEVLVAEKVILETSERVRLLTHQISDNTYSRIPEEALHKGCLHLSNLKFPFSKKLGENHKPEKHFTEFFLMTISHGTEMFVSEFITGEEDPLNFKREYKFENVAPDFEIKVKLFCLKLRTSDEKIWEKFGSSSCCPTSRILYEDHLTHQYQERIVFKTSFKLCAETILTHTQINESTTKLTVDPQVYNKLSGTMEHQFKCVDVDMSVEMSGFMDVGTVMGETYFWETKWCALRGPNLFIYNYPQDEYLGKPVEQINLEYCFGPIITKVDNCPRRRCFLLRTGRPNDVTSQNSNKPAATLRSKPNFTLRKFFFAASNKTDYDRWTVEVKKLLDSLNYFKKLAFDEEYYDS